MWKHLLLFILIQVAFETIQASECPDYPCLIFEDEFDTFNLDVWQHEITGNGGGNGEFEYYTNNRSNSYVKDGVLYIKPTLTADTYGEEFLSTGRLDLWGSQPADQCTSAKSWGCVKNGKGEDKIISPIQSARIRTVHSFSVRYGRVEFEAQMPRGDWLWPAIWMLPTRHGYGNWPASGEIDLIEARGNDKLKDQWGNNLNNKRVISTLMWGPYNSQQQWQHTHESTKAGNYTDTFHKWRMDWDEDSIIIYVDEVALMNATLPDGGFWELGDFSNTLPGIENPWQGGSKMAPFDKEFHFLMNVAVGGTNGYFPDGVEANNKPWENKAGSPKADFWNGRDIWYPTWDGEGAALKVNYIRVWKLADN